MRVIPVSRTRLLVEVAPDIDPTAAASEVRVPSGTRFRTTPSGNARASAVQGPAAPAWLVARPVTTTPRVHPWDLAHDFASQLPTRATPPVQFVEPDLLQALMREESALDPQALSWAGALGLTQLMPYTAKAVAQRLKIGKLTPARLLEPEINIRIGSAYLGDLMRRFEGTFELALAGYNAGGGAVDRWRRDRPDLELDEWVEEIPIAETRGYVKRVLRSYNTYRLLYPRALDKVTIVWPQ